MTVRRSVLAWAARLIERWLNADHSDQLGPAVACSCGQAARYVDRRQKSVQTALGKLELRRAYYYCSPCQAGFCPRDRRLGIEGHLSPALLRMMASVGAMVSFEEGSQLLDELAGIQVDAKQVERTAKALGAEVAADERQDWEPIATSALPPTLYLGMDGTGIPMRASELVGRTGKQLDGSAKSREVKLCTIWSAESRDADGIPVRDEGSVSYSAAIESAAALDTDPHRSAFAERVWREAQRRRFCQAQRTVALGDGAPWIWNLVDELFLETIQIVDRFHAKQHLSDLGKVLYGPTDPRASQWAQQRHDELDAGQLRALVAAIRPHVTHCDEARRCLHYFWTNRKRMRYPKFHAQGLCTSTGVVEAGCKVAIGTRLKRAGMHWTVRGANAIIALRCSKLSGRFQDFWERRSDRRVP
jgi:hypothetical protein